MEIEESGEIYMLKKILLVFIIFMSMSLPVFADTSSDNADQSKQKDQPNQIETVNKRLKDSIVNGSPENIQKNIEAKGNSLFQTVKSSSVLYFSIVVGAFLILMVGGIFFKKLVSLAFITLVLGIIGYIIINFAPDILRLVVKYIT